ncbi:hypothetical protein [Lentzea sp. NPDC003310]|uniref:hypothetical protein n=1 Tax=Lentzea sp. NPDC003310 TaxID=3154447 RepID=UPI0033A39793
MKNDPIRELTDTSNKHGERLGLIERTLSTRQENLGEITRRIRDLERKVGKHTVESALDKAKAVATDLATTNTRVAGQAETIAELRRNVHALDRRIRVSDRLPRADFDTWPEISPDTIRLIRDGLGATPVSEAEVLQSEQRLAEQQEELAHWDASLKAAREALLALTVATTLSEKVWRGNERTWRAFRVRGLRPADKEEQARRQHDEAVDARKTAKLAASLSEEADEAARAVIHDRVKGAIALDHVTPRWFDTALGPFPPLTPERIRPWLTVAVRLVRYRLLAGYHDSVHPYGDRPADEALGAEHDRVVRACEEQRR